MKDPSAERLGTELVSPSRKCCDPLISSHAKGMSYGARGT